MASNTTRNTSASSRERWIGSVGGGALVAIGLRQRGLWGTALAALGGGLALSAVIGRGLHLSLGQDAEHPMEPQQPNDFGAGARATEKKLANDGIDVEQRFTVNRGADELYSFWHNFENLPQFMKHLESVQVLDNQRSHWVSKAPAGTTVEWDAALTADQPNQLIAWRSLPDADVDNAGEVRFQAASGGRGTEVHVKIKYSPPAGKIGSVIAKLFGEEPDQQVKGDLRRFKQLMETGEIPTNEGQSTGTRSLLGKVFSPNS